MPKLKAIRTKGYRYNKLVLNTETNETKESKKEMEFQKKEQGSLSQKNTKKIAEQAEQMLDY